MTRQEREENLKRSLISIVFELTTGELNFIVSQGNGRGKEWRMTYGYGCSDDIKTEEIKPLTGGLAS